MRFKRFGLFSRSSLLLLILVAQFAVATNTEQVKPAADYQIRLKRQNGYGNGNGMWNNDNFPAGNWNGPNSNGFGGSGPQGPPPDDGIKGSIGTKEEKKPEDDQNGNNGEGQGQGPWWPNGGNPNGYNSGPNPNMYSGNGFGSNGYNNGPNTFNGGNLNGGPPVEDGIKGSVGAAVEPTKAPYPPNSYGYGNRAGYGNNNGYGTNGFGFNRMSGYGNNFGRPILPRAERYSHRRQWRY